MKHETLTERLIGIFYEVYNELGHGFLESIYQNAFVVALGEKEIRHEQQIAIEVFFHGVSVGDFRADLVAESCVLIELKAVNALDRSHEKQILNYLKSTKLEVGLLLNFGPRPQVRRFVMDNETKTAKPSSNLSAAASSAN